MTSNLEFQFSTGRMWLCVLPGAQMANFFWWEKLVVLVFLDTTWPEKQEYTLTISLPSWEQTWHIPYQTNILQLMIFRTSLPGKTILIHSPCSVTNLKGCKWLAPLRNLHAAKAVIEVDKNTLLRRLRGHGDAVTCASFAEADKSRTLDPQKWEISPGAAETNSFLLHLKMDCFGKCCGILFGDGKINKRNKLGAELISFTEGNMMTCYIMGEIGATQLQLLDALCANLWRSWQQKNVKHLPHIFSNISLFEKVPLP